MANNKGVHINDLPKEAQERIKGRLPAPNKEEVTRATVAVLNALNATGLPVSAWWRALELAKRWLGKESTRRTK